MSVIEKVSQILDLIATSDEPTSLINLQRRLSLPKSTLYRLAQDMSSAGFLTKTSGGRYSLGYRLLYWGRQARESQWLAIAAEPAMTALRDAIGENVHLYVRHGTSRVCIAAVDGPNILRTFIEMGKELPLSHGAAGKVLLAFSPEEIIREVLEACSESDPEREQQLRIELPEIRARRFAMSEGEREPGVSAAAVPIIGPDEEVVSAISISGASTFLPADQLESARPLLHDCAQSISRSSQVRVSGV